MKTLIEEGKDPDKLIYNYTSHNGEMLTVRGHIEHDDRLQRDILFNEKSNRIGYYDIRRNQTKTDKGNDVGTGNLLAGLLLLFKA